MVENKLFGEASLDGKGEKLSHEVVVNSNNSPGQAVKGNGGSAEMRFSTAKVTTFLLTLTDKLTRYRQRDVLIFPRLCSSGDGHPSPDTSSFGSEA